MSSVDTRLQKFWNFSTCLHRAGGDSWLTFLQSMAQNDTGIAQKAAITLLARRAKEEDETNTG